MAIGIGFSDQDTMTIRTFSGFCMGTLLKKSLQRKGCCVGLFTQRHKHPKLEKSLRGLRVITSLRLACPLTHLLTHLLTQILAP